MVVIVGVAAVGGGVVVAGDEGHVDYDVGAVGDGDDYFGDVD